jgi:UDP-N-acetylmuramoylalanine--D-glutamate ligase
VGATVAALHRAWAPSAGKLVVILGGDGKGQDFTPLAAPVARHARAVVLIGRDAPLRAALENTGVPLLDADSMQMRCQARQCARAGDAVLMSPGLRQPSTCSQLRAPRRRCSARSRAELADAAGVELEGAA